MRHGCTGAIAGALLVLARSARAEGLLVHDSVDGANLDVMDLVAPGPNGKTESIAFTELGKPKPVGTYALRFAVSGEDLRIPHCNGRGAVTVDGTVRDKGSKGPLVLHLGGEAVHDVRVDIAVSPYEKRIACGERVRVGTGARSSEGIALLKFASAHAGPAAGEAVVFVPRGHDPKKPGPLLVGVHPWNGGPWTYAAYRELLEEAQAKDVLLLMPSGLGNSLYVKDAEDEVLLAMDAARAEVAVDPQRVSIWGASMGGQGATTIGFHRPDRFAFVASYFGDAKFDLSTYVRNILPTEEVAHRVNPLDVIDNARHVPLWLIHGEDDKTSPIVQSVMLFEAMQKRHFQVDFDRVPGMAHEGPLVVKFVRRVVDRAQEAKSPLHPAHVTFRSVSPYAAEAYGVRLVRIGERDAYVDIEKRDDGIHVLPATEGVSQIVLRPGALGAKESDRVVVEKGAAVKVRWEAP